MKKRYTEVRIIFADDLRNLCITKGWYTRGADKEYSHMLHVLAAEGKNITTEDIVEIAEDIMEHSDTDQELTSICFDIAKIAVTFFEEV